MAVGQCSICGWKGEFLHPEEGREGLHCGNCASSARLRAVMHWLGTLLGQDGRPVFEWPVVKSLKILESSPRGSYAMMLADKYDYYETEFDPARLAENSRRFADFQNLHYADNTFDVVIASDVFEHVRDDASGYREIYRTLKPGGTFLLTVPYTHEQSKTILRVDTSGGKDVPLMDPEYHGGGGHTLTYRTYGRDLLTLLKQTGFSVMHAVTSVPHHAIVSQSVIIAQKSDFLEFPRAPSPTGKMSSLGSLIPYRIFLLMKYNAKGFVRQLKQIARS